MRAKGISRYAQRHVDPPKKKYEKDAKPHRLMHSKTMKYTFFTHHIGKKNSKSSGHPVLAEME